MKPFGACTVCFVLLISPGAGARRPWKPNASVLPTQAVGTRRPLLDPAVRQRFEQRYARGLADLARGRYHQARIALEEAVRLHPDHTGVRRALARTLLTLGYLRWSPAMVRTAHGHVLRARALLPNDTGLRLMAELIDSLLTRMRTAASGKNPAKK